MTSRAIFTVTAGAAAICSAISRAVASSSSAGTTRRHDAVRERLLGRQHAAGEHHVAHDAVAAHLVEHGRRRRCRGSRRRSTSGSMNRVPSAAIRMSHSSARWNEPPIDPALARDDDRRVDVPELLDAAVAAAHQLVVATARPCTLPIEPTSRPDENDLPSPRQMTARTSGRASQLAEDLEQLRVHVVVERVVLVGVVVGDRGDRRRRSRAGLPWSCVLLRARAQGLSDASSSIVRRCDASRSSSRPSAVAQRSVAPAAA